MKKVFVPRNAVQLKRALKFLNKRRLSISIWLATQLIVEAYGCEKNI